MSLIPVPVLLDKTLRDVVRRYRLPAMAGTPSQTQETNPATALAMAIEQARWLASLGKVPDAALKRLFIDALARLIHEAMRTESGDPAFQAMALRHRAQPVREYASLVAHAAQDRRAVRVHVNAIAHPAKQQRLPPGRQREALAQLHASAFSSSWSALVPIAQRLLAMPETTSQSPVRLSLTRLLDGPERGRLRHLETLTSNELVLQYQLLWDQHGPRQGSPDAHAQGSASRKRGSEVEALATRALEMLVLRLNESDEARTAYRVVTSMRVPASIPGNPDRAKSEWDTVLLRQAETIGATTTWDVCLLVEAKASVEAATTDLPRLLRGLQLLAHADPTAIYPFETRQGTVHLHGASLSALTTDEACLKSTILYCCDAPVETTPRLLSAASRMQLLSAPPSLDYAGALAEKRFADPQSLEPVWHSLLESPRWRAVLYQHSTLRQVRELMVHTDDLMATAVKPPTPTATTGPISPDSQA